MLFLFPGRSLSTGDALDRSVPAAEFILDKEENGHRCHETPDWGGPLGLARMADCNWGTALVAILTTCSSNSPCGRWPLHSQHSKDSNLLTSRATTAEEF